MKSRKWLVPETVQTSMMDCGPACLNALLGGYGIYASYGRLREACQTGLDGTSIDTIEELANRLGLQAEQIVVPADHIPLREAAALPAIAVVKLPSGVTHFVVIWRCHRGTLQIMDPASGRQWTSVTEFSRKLYLHEMLVGADQWRAWAETEEFAESLGARLKAVDGGSGCASGLLPEAFARPGWRALATLDAGTRMVGGLVGAGALAAGEKASRLLRATVERAIANPQQADAAIPRPYWSVWPAGSEGELVARGAVLVRVKGRTAAGIDFSALPKEVATAVQEAPPQPARELWRLLKQDGMLAPGITGVALLFASLGVVLQVLLFRALMQGGRELEVRSSRLGAVTAVLLLLTILLALEIPAASALLGMGRRLEARFRAAILRKLPRIAEEYFHSRPISDMAERSHNVHYLRMLPNLGGQILRSGFELVLTAAGILWIDPHLWPWAALAVAAAVGLPALAQPALAERTLRVRTHAGALSRFYLDSLLGLVPVRSHVADNTIRVEHRSLLAKWAAAALGAQRVGIGIEGMQLGVGYLLAALLTISHMSRYPESAAVLLIAYWSLNLPMIGRDLVGLACEYPMYRNIALRLMEPLTAIERRSPDAGEQEGHRLPTAGIPDSGAALRLEQVAVVAGGHSVLHDISLDIPSGSHIAIVGGSGAGKSTLAAVLLGWRAPTCGSLAIDGQPFSEAMRDGLQRSSAWVDPGVRLWNRSLLDNLRYGVEGNPNVPMGEAVDQAELASVLEKLPEGFETVIGDSGAMLSEGEGQRVRLARALLRPGVRLAVLDEPFRGLDAEMRQNLLEMVRSHWRVATLVFVTHDVAAARSFDRVVVMEGGAIAEEGHPAQLAKLPGSRYAALLREEQDLKRHLLSTSEWRRLRMQRGAISEEYEPLLRDGD
jgi:ABC-type bacteriocin/lantibiotic exporter with double-glycine peptidase domain